MEGTWGWEKLGYGGRQNTEFVIDQNDQFPIGPMYTGHYFFGCTLPNAIIESNKPLRLEIRLDEHEITSNDLVPYNRPIHLVEPQHRGFDTSTSLHPHPINEGVKRGEGG